MLHVHVHLWLAIVNVSQEFISHCEGNLNQNFTAYALLGHGLHKDQHQLIKEIAFGIFVHLSVDTCSDDQVPFSLYILIQALTN